MSANVLIQTAFLGDLLLSIPLIKKIKLLWPEQKLLLVCRRGVGDFFLKTQLVDEVFEITKGDSSSYKRILKRLNEHKIEKVFSPHESLRTAFFARKIRAVEKISFAKSWSWIFYKQNIQKNLELPEAIRQLSLLQNIDSVLAQEITTYGDQASPYEADSQGRLSTVPAWASMKLDFKVFRDETESLLAKFQLDPQRVSRAVAFFPGSVWATKRWTEEGFVQVGQALSHQEVPVLIMGGPGEEELCERIARQIPKALNICGKTSIFESALVLSQVAAAVGNDSASMHLAATTGTPSVVIFGPTVLEFGFRPWQDHVYVIEKKELSCRPCGKHGHQVCPIGTHVCMKSIHKAEVLDKLERVLK